MSEKFKNMLRNTLETSCIFDGFRYELPEIKFIINRDGEPFEEFYDMYSFIEKLIYMLEQSFRVTYTIEVSVKINGEEYEVGEDHETRFNVADPGDKPCYITDIFTKKEYEEDIMHYIMNMLKFLKYVSLKNE